MSKSIARARRLMLACLAAAGAILALAACGGSSNDKSSSAGGNAASVDDGTKITMWTRAATSAYSQLLVDAYNKGHKNQVKLTVIPTDSYQPKIAAAAGGRSLPDVLSADVVFVPNYASKGLLADLTSRVNALKFKDRGTSRRPPTRARSTPSRTTSTSRRCSTTRSSSRRRAWIRRSRRRP
jgi:multiple sugar transport system substrate-binding protein